MRQSKLSKGKNWVQGRSFDKKVSQLRCLKEACNGLSETSTAHTPKKLGVSVGKEDSDATLAAENPSEWQTQDGSVSSITTNQYSTDINRRGSAIRALRQ